MVDDKLEVRVANEKTWRLNKKAIVEFEVGGLTVVQTFWITEDIDEDIFFGINGP